MQHGQWMILSGTHKLPELADNNGDKVNIGKGLTYGLLSALEHQIDFFQGTLPSCLIRQISIPRYRCPYIFQLHSARRSNHTDWAPLHTSSIDLFLPCHLIRSRAS